MSKIIGYILGILMVMLVFSPLPLLVMWALNVFFDLKIPIDFRHWLAGMAVLAIFLVLRGRGRGE